MQIHFDAPANGGPWFMTGKIYWPLLNLLRHCKPPQCEWINEEGFKVWEPGRFSGLPDYLRE